MADSAVLIAIGSGLVLGAGTWLIGHALWARTPSLATALAGLPVRGAAHPLSTDAAVLVAEHDGRLERWSSRLVTSLRLPLGRTTTTLLALQGRSVGEHYASKFILGLVGLLLPSVLSVLTRLLGTPIGSQALLVGLLLGVAGFLLPDLTLRRQVKAAHADASDALGVFVDLIILERLANASATQAIHEAARRPCGPVFGRIRNVLDQARLQQRPPWQDLRELSHELELPELGDLADILQLDEQGAALSSSLQARVSDLRRAQLAADRIRATERTERMSLWMVAPVILFALALLCPPLLRLVGSG